MSCRGETHHTEWSARTTCGLWLPPDVPGGSPYAPASGPFAWQVTDQPGDVTCKRCRRILDLLAESRRRIEEYDPPTGPARLVALSANHAASSEGEQ